jgi:hypothetical protein
LFISADAAKEKEKKRKKVLLLTGVSKSAAHTVNVDNVYLWVLHGSPLNMGSYLQGKPKCQFPTQVFKLENSSPNVNYFKSIKLMIIYEILVSLLGRGLFCKTLFSSKIQNFPSTFGMLRKTKTVLLGGILKLNKNTGLVIKH